MGLDDWRFLEGTWMARSTEENAFGEEGHVEGEQVFKVDLGGKFVTGRERFYQGEREIHTALSVLFYDEECARACLVPIDDYDVQNTRFALGIFMKCCIF